MSDDGGSIDNCKTVVLMLKSIGGPRSRSGSAFTFNIVLDVQPKGCEQHCERLEIQVQEASCAHALVFFVRYLWKVAIVPSHSKFMP